MNSLREIVDSASQLRSLANLRLRGDDEPRPLGPSIWNWEAVQRVLVIRLRSIGDTVLATPSLFCLKRFVPHAEVDVLLEDWVAPLLSDFQFVDNVISIPGDSSTARARIARKLRQARYDVIYNLHGGTTATLLTRAAGAPHRVGYSNYQYSRLHNHVAPPPSSLWERQKVHSVEQQLALLGWTGVPVTDRPPTRLGLMEEALDSVTVRLRAAGLSEGEPFALLHPAAAFETKRWAIENYAQLVDVLKNSGLPVVALFAPNEAGLAAELIQRSTARVVAFTDLSLPEVTALAYRARLFVGNDSGIAHIAAAVGTPVVVIFGSSNVIHWGPWTSTPAATVLEEMDCQPCHGYFCEKYDEPECIKRVPVERVVAAIERVLKETA